MRSSRLLLGSGLGLVFLLAAHSVAVQGQNKGEPPPSDAEIQQQIQRLDLKNPVEVRREAAEWLRQHFQARNVSLARPALEQCIRTDPAAPVRDAAVIALGRSALERNERCPRAIIDAMLDNLRSDIGAKRLSVN
jgi:hypothetical protein